MLFAACRDFRDLAGSPDNVNISSLSTYAYNEGPLLIMMKTISLSISYLSISYLMIISISISDLYQSLPYPPMHVAGPCADHDEDQDHEKLFFSEN